MSVIKFDSAAKAAERDPRNAKLFFETIGAGFDQSKIDQISADKARPFVSPMAWAVFRAYQAVVIHSVMRWHVLKGGLGPNDFADRNAIEKLVVAALPHYKEYLEKHGPDVYYYVLDGLETKLLSELQTTLTGADFDKASLEQAAEIIRQATALQATTAEEQGTVERTA